MQSFRSEIENPIVEKDIVELADKIQLFHEGKIDEEKFRSLRLARGVYGQRQFGVQMIRIKLPYGKVTSNQLLKIADVSDEYSRGRLHITTRQDIQIHYVSLDRTPELWAELEKSDVTIREACGNAVRNVTASETAGIDIDEPFDVSPYAHGIFKYFLRNPICQEMGRKFKVSFSATDADTGLSYLHDIGFIAKIKEENGETIRGFKVMLGGGLGSQPREADVAYEFLPTNQIIPFMESVLRIFDRYGERSKRAKARLKFLIKDLGLDGFRALIDKETKALAHHTFEIEVPEETAPVFQDIEVPQVSIEDEKAYATWKNTNVIPQKQKGLYAIGIRVKIGDFYTPEARKLANLIKTYAADELRFTLRQNILIRHVREELLPFFYQELAAMGFVNPGYNTASDITACPGTDTCNLGIASSTGIAKELENVIENEYPQYLNNKDVVIKISGCMNACGQHNMAHIGFQGMSLKAGGLTAPALQVLLGGGTLGNGKGRFADKLVKIPSKRGPEALRLILNDYEKVAESQSFVDYYVAKGDRYFYDLLKELSRTDNLTPEDFIDWGSDNNYVKQIGVGECAGVVIDLVATLFFDSEEKIQKAKDSIADEKWSDAIYHAYSSIVNTAKALLTSKGEKTNTHNGIIENFDKVFVAPGLIPLKSSFESFIYQINQNEPSASFAKHYIENASQFYQTAVAFRENELATTDEK